MMNQVHQKQYKIGVLGATGTVGQRFISLLAEHPFFVIHALGASSRSAGKPYSKAVNWKQTRPIPAVVREMVVHECAPAHFKDCVIVFSGLDADVAGDIGASSSDPLTLPPRPHTPPLPVCLCVCGPSRARLPRRRPRRVLEREELPPRSARPAHRPAREHRPLLDHPAAAAPARPALRKGFIVTNANCSTTAVVVPLAALERAFGPIESCMITTMQAISGAGYPGVPSLDIVDNVVPYIPGEEEKIEWETLKILGGLAPPHDADDDNNKHGSGNGSVLAFDMHAAQPLRVSASCTRVPVVEGHTECVSVRFARRPPPSPQQVREALQAYTSEAYSIGCPSAPRHTVFVHEEADRPQPRLDRDYQGGAGVCVGRVRQCRVLDVKFVVLANNVAIGAATSSIINAEYAVLKGIVSAA
uniref:aspartate-semialdehyde dehydrogenase n=1 Tax=Ganoderma boninense TaxID=34458 RepID=A0A5K1K7B1_9APHY|nr:STE/STE11 protein kinase [Ganoderma boninense]